MVAEQYWASNVAALASVVVAAAAASKLSFVPVPKGAADERWEEATGSEEVFVGAVWLP